MTLPDDRLNAILDSLYAEVPGRARLLEQHIEALTDEIGRVRAAHLSHSLAVGYVLGAWDNNTLVIVHDEAFPILADANLELDLAVTFADDATATMRDKGATVYGLVPIDQFEDGTADE